MSVLLSMQSAGSCLHHMSVIFPQNTTILHSGKDAFQKMPLVFSERFR
jgi:hypothetical protein